MAEETKREARKRDCEYAKSDMTPCVLRDGPICFADDGHCVGCGRTAEEIGVPPPDKTRRT
jgi:hypothetical protein